MNTNINEATRYEVITSGDRIILEKLEKKFILNKLHLEFNEICIKDFLPNYTNIYIYTYIFIAHYNR